MVLGIWVIGMIGSRGVTLTPSTGSGQAQSSPIEGEEAGAPRVLIGPTAAGGFSVALGWGLGAYDAEFVVLAAFSPV